MWFLYAAASAFFAGAVTVILKYGTDLGKCGAEASLAVRTTVVLLFSWVTVLCTGSAGNLSKTPFILLLLSGVSSWISFAAYFRALEKSSVLRVAAAEKLSAPLTAAGAFLFLGEGKKSPGFGASFALCAALIACGACLMLTSEKQKSEKAVKEGLTPAVVSAFFAAASALFSKAGLNGGAAPELAFAVRTGVCFMLSWAFLIIRRRGFTKKIVQIKARAMLILIVTGLITGFSWLCSFRALEIGVAGLVQPTEKLGILVSAALAHVFFGEKLNRKAAAGLTLLSAGILLPSVIFYCAIVL